MFSSAKTILGAMLGSAFVTVITFSTLVFLGGCVTDVVEAEDVLDPSDLAEIAEAYCEANPELTCGHVYLCQTPSTNPDNEYGRIEICKLDDHPLEWLEAVHGSCEPTPRHQGLCWWCCGEGCGAGGNAYDGTFCPDATPMLRVPDGLLEYGPEIPVHVKPSMLLWLEDEYHD